MAGADDDLELLDVAPQPVARKTTVSSGSSRRNQVLAALGVIVAGVVVWSIASGSGADNAVGEDGTEESIDEVEDEGADDDGTTSDTTVDDASEQDEEPEEPIVGTLLDPVDPLLSGSGLTLYAQRNDGSVNGMVGVDLDSGVVTNYGYRYDEIVLQSDEYLVVRDFDPERHSAISLLEPTTTPRVISKNTWIVAAREEGGESVVAFLAAVETDGGATRYTEMTIDLDIGTIIYRGTLRDSHPFLPNNRFSSDTTLFTGPAGGVYEVRGPAYEQVADGRILGFDDTFAILERCDDSLACSIEWVQRSDWTVVDRPLPPGEFEHARIFGGGRILVVREQFSAPQVFDVESNDFLDVGSIDSVEAIAVSPDGAFLAISSSEGITVIDVAAGVPVGPPITDLQSPVSLAISPS